MTEIRSYEELTSELRARAAQHSNPERQAQLQTLFQALERTLVQSAPKVGHEAPDFVLHEAGSGERVQLAEVLSRGPVVLSFYRGQWCPYCNLEVRAAVYPRRDPRPRRRHLPDWAGDCRERLEAPREDRIHDPIALRRRCGRMSALWTRLRVAGVLPGELPRRRQRCRPRIQGQDGRCRSRLRL